MDFYGSNLLWMQHQNVIVFVTFQTWKDLSPLVINQQLTWIRDFKGLGCGDLFKVWKENTKMGEWKQKERRKSIKGGGRKKNTAVAFPPCCVT